MNKKNVLIVILAIIIIVGLFYITRQELLSEREEWRIKGIQEGQLILIQQIQTSGVIPFISNGTIQSITISKLCEQINVSP